MPSRRRARARRGRRGLGAAAAPATGAQPARRADRAPSQRLWAVAVRDARRRHAGARGLPRPAAGAQLLGHLVRALRARDADCSIASGATFASAGWQVVGLAIDQADAVQDFLQRTPVGFPIGLAGLDGAGPVARRSATRAAACRSPPCSMRSGRAGRAPSRRDPLRAAARLDTLNRALRRPNAPIVRQRRVATPRSTGRPGATMPACNCWSCTAPTSTCSARASRRSMAATTLAEIDADLQRSRRGRRPRAGRRFQSNHEGALIDRVQAARDDGTALHPDQPGRLHPHQRGAARRAGRGGDAVHRSAPVQRARARAVPPPLSYFSATSPSASICGLGADGYRYALALRSRGCASSAALPPAPDAGAAAGASQS